MTAHVHSTSSMILKLQLNQNLQSRHMYRYPYMKHEQFKANKFYNYSNINIQSKTQMSHYSNFINDKYIHMKTIQKTL